MTKSAIQHITSLFQEQSLSIQMAAELECYICDDSSFESLAAILDSDMSVCLKQEEGQGQIELVFDICAPDQLITSITKIKHTLLQYADISFEANPLGGEPSSGLHIHISLWQNDMNLFAKPQDGQEESQVMRYAIGGLLHRMKQDMLHFAPTESCYKRYVPGKYTPSTVSWGGNNRTVAIRVPTSTTDPSSRHIEHRVASAAADPDAVIACVLKGVYQGIQEQIDPGEKIYGDAFQPHYQCELLPQSLAEARLLVAG